MDSENCLKLKAKADQLLREGIKQYQTNIFEAALLSLQQALNIYRSIEHHKDEGLVLGNIGLVYEALGDYKQAIEYQLQSLTIAQELQDILWERVSLKNIGLVYEALENYAQAIEYWQKLLTFVQQTENYAEQGQILLDIGIAYYRLQNFSQAIEHYQQSLVFKRKIRDQYGEAYTLGNLGLAYYSLKNYNQAIEFYQQSLTLIRQIQDHQAEAQVLINMVKVYNALGDNAEAIKYQQQRLYLSQQIQDRYGEGKALGDIGTNYYNQGEYNQAIEYYQQSLLIAQQIQDYHIQRQVLLNLGNAYDALGKYAQATEYYQQSLSIAQQIQDSLGEGKALGGLGLIFYRLGNYAQAIEYHQQHLAIARKVEDRWGEEAALRNLGIAYYCLADYSKAVEYYQQDLALSRELQDQLGEGQALGNLGLVYNALGDYTQAIEYHQQNLTLTKIFQNPEEEEATLSNLGLAYFGLGNYSKAIEYHQLSLALALKIKDRLGESIGLGNLGLAYSGLGNYSKAIEYHQLSLALAQEIKDQLREGQALNNLGADLFTSGKLKEAEITLFNGIKVWELLRAQLGSNDAYKISIFEQQDRTYLLLQQVLIAQNQFTVALEISERGRSRALMDLLRGKIFSRLEPQFGTSLPNIEQIKEIAKNKNTTFVEYSIIYDNFPLEGKLQIQESELFIWVIKSTGEINFRKVDLKLLWHIYKKTLADFVVDFRESIGARGRDAKLVSNSQSQYLEQEFSRQLYDILIQPIEELLTTDANSHVTFIPQKFLFLLPFPALQDTEGKYLIEKHTILTSPSIQVLELTRQQQVKKLTSKTLIVGNPTMPKIAIEIGQKPQKLRPLPGSEQEAIEIARLLKTQYFTGDEATKTAILQNMPTAGIIHLATHGLLDDFQGNNIPGAIALAPSGDDNGILTSEEIFGLKLQAELLVLSACDTGRGRVTGDGVIGLSRSFISAGVSSIVVSLWSVPDDSTAFLMTAFYQNLKNNLDKAQALRQAMLMTMKENPNPRYWAAFTLIGEAEWGLNPINI